MKLKRFFASLCLVLVLFSVSLVPCFANTQATSSSDYVMTVFVGDQTSDNPVMYNQPVHVPSAEVKSVSLAQVVSNFYGIYFNVYSNSFEPASYDRTVFLNLTVLTTGTNDAYLPGGSKPDMVYSTDEDNSRYTYTDAVEWVSWAASTGGACFKVTIPAGASSFYFTTQNYLHFNVYGSSVQYNIASFGAYVINSADAGVLGAVEGILEHTQNIDANTTLMVAAINQILDQLRLLNADTDTIITMLDSLTTLSQTQLNFLEDISGNVEAIYAFLVDALREESSAADESVQNAADSLGETARNEIQWQEFMSSSYEDLAIQNFTFGPVAGGVQLVSTIFSDIFDAFAPYQILFTFPLSLGIVLLVVGRLSKFGGGNSSRQKEHKGGEGGA